MRRETDASIETSNDPWSPAELRESQLEDLNLRPVIEWMEAPETAPDWEEVLKLSVETKKLWTRTDLPALVEGVLYRKWVTGIGSRRWMKPVPQKGLRKEIMRLVHVKAVGYLGIRRTREQLHHRAFWKGWKGDVERYCRACEGCSRYHRGVHKGMFLFETCWRCSLGTNWN